MSTPTPQPSSSTLPTSHHITIDPLILLDSALATMTQLHSAIVPDEDGEFGLVPPNALRTFVDKHAALAFERKRLALSPKPEATKQAVVYTPDDDITSQQREQMYYAVLGCTLNISHRKHELYIDASSRHAAQSAATAWFDAHEHRRRCPTCGHTSSIHWMGIYSPIQDLALEQGAAA